jgi:hypothetical protein
MFITIFYQKRGGERVHRSSLLGFFVRVPAKPYLPFLCFRRGHDLPDSIEDQLDFIIMFFYLLAGDLICSLVIAGRYCEW